MVGKAVAATTLAVLGIAALDDFITIYHGHLQQFGFFSVSFGIFSLCAAVFTWRYWDKICAAYTYQQTAKEDGVELPRVAWSERLGMGALFNLRDHPERPRSQGGSDF